MGRAILSTYCIALCPVYTSLTWFICWDFFLYLDFMFQRSTHKFSHNPEGGDRKSTATFNSLYSTSTACFPPRLFLNTRIVVKLNIVKTINEVRNVHADDFWRGNGQWCNTSLDQSWSLVTRWLMHKFAFALLSFTVVISIFLLYFHSKCESVIGTNQLCMWKNR